MDEIDQARSMGLRGGPTRVTVIASTVGRGAPAVTNARFVLRVLGEDGSVHLERAGQTDDVGVAQVEVPRGIVRTRADGALNVLVRVAEPGFQQRARFVRSTSARLLDAAEVRLVLVKGSTRFGSVVGLGGDVPDLLAPGGPRLTAHRWIESGGERFLGRSPWAVETLGQGRFAVHLAARPDGEAFGDREPSAPGILLAHDSRLGTGSLILRDLRADQADLKIVMGGPGGIVGCLTDGSGSPVEDQVVVARLAEFDGLPIPGRRSALDQLRVEGGGFVEQEVRTDADGRFRFTGLRGADYSVLVRLPHGDAAQERGLGRVSALASGPIELEYARPTLAISLWDLEGAPWMGDGLSIGRVGGGVPSTLADGPQVYVSDAGAVGDVPEHRGPFFLLSRCARTTGQLGVLEYDLPEGRQYFVTAVGGGFSGEPQLVQMKVGAGRQDVSMTQRVEDAGIGRLEVRIEDESGHPTDRGIRWTVLDALHGVPLLRIETGFDGLVTSARLPAGKYRVVAERTSARVLDVETDETPGLRAQGRASAEVTVKAGSTLEVPLLLRAPG